MANDKPQSLLDLFTSTCRDASSFLSALEGKPTEETPPESPRTLGTLGRSRVIEAEGEELGPPPVLPPDGARQWLAQRIRAALLASYERTPPVPDVAGARGLEVLRLLIGEAALTSAESAAIWHQCSSGHPRKP